MNKTQDLMDASATALASVQSLSGADHLKKTCQTAWDHDLPDGQSEGQMDEPDDSPVLWDQKLAEAWQTISDFCGMRDVDELNAKSVREFFDGKSADVLVLFGGSTIHGLSPFVRAMRSGAASCSIIVGGYGHTSARLLDEIERQTGIRKKTEAEAFETLLEKQYGLQADFLETASTNCGNNITLLLDLLRQHQIPARRLIFIQDPSMQRRMDATLHKNSDAKVLNFAACRPVFVNKEGRLALDLAKTPDYSDKTGEDLTGMWDLKSCCSLLAGEMERLPDTAEGYGPKGKGFIAHVDIPESVKEAWDLIRRKMPGCSRKANMAFADALDHTPTAEQAEYQE